MEAVQHPCFAVNLHVSVFHLIDVIPNNFVAGVDIVGIMGNIRVSAFAPYLPFLWHRLPNNLVLNRGSNLHSGAGTACEVASPESYY